MPQLGRGPGRWNEREGGMALASQVKTMIASGKRTAQAPLFMDFEAGIGQGSGFAARCCSCVGARLLVRLEAPEMATAA